LDFLRLRPQAVGGVRGVRFQRSGPWVVPGWSGYAASRSAPFELVIPDERGELSSETYRPEAIREARAAPGEWEVNYLVVLGWLITFLTFWLGWRLFRFFRSADHGPPAAGFSRDGRGGGG
jgi:hypothetical protein